MKRITRCLILAVTTAACALVLAEESGEVKACYEEAQTQFDLNQCAALDVETAERELDEAYEAVLSKYRGDDKQVARLRAAQAAWIEFRDAEMEALFPHRDDSTYYGSIFPMRWNRALAGLVRERTARLRWWREAADEDGLS